MLKFKLNISTIKTFPDEFSNELLKKEINNLIGTEYSLICNSPSNNYQLTSNFDAIINNKLIEFGAKPFDFAPNCKESIDFDFSLKVKDIKTVFEVEKANKEKLLYDLLKMHIYLESGAEIAVLICPTNWAHSGGTIDLFALAKARFNLCKKYGMVDQNKISNILIVGFTQTYNGAPLTSSILKQIKAQCKTHFSST